MTCVGGSVLALIDLRRPPFSRAEPRDSVRYGTWVTADYDLDIGRNSGLSSDAEL